jgi:hypothetical protein
MDNEHAEKLPDPWAVKHPDWTAWQTIQRTRLWKAVALMCDIDPASLESAFFPDKLDTVFNPPTGQFAEWLTLAKSAIGSDLLRTVSLNAACLEDSEVTLSSVATWAAAISLKLPAGFIWQPNTITEISNWPWGRHNTVLLQKLAMAADRFWKNYDPSDPSTAPTNKQVSDWLVQQNVSTRTAEGIATILRVDGLPTGPRK